MDFKDVEKAKQAYKAKVKKHLLISLSIAAIIAFVASLSNGTGSILGFFVVFLMAGVFVAIFALFFIILFTRKEAQAYKSAYKAYFVEKTLQKTFTGIKYDHASGLSASVLAATQMVNTGDRYSSNDFVTGKYKDVAFTQADVHIEEEHTDDEGHTSYVTIFKGRFMIFEFPKKFNFRLEVAEKWFGANRIPSKNPKTGRKFEKIEVESPEFNRTFKTYAEDGFEAFYLLDPAFINNILTLSEQYKGKILLGFLDNKLLVGLKDNKDSFEPPSVFKTLDEQTEFAKVAQDIHLITNFVDTLKLNHKLFS